MQRSEMRTCNEKSGPEAAPGENQESRDKKIRQKDPKLVILNDNKEPIKGSTLVQLKQTSHYNLTTHYYILYSKNSLIE